MDISNILVGDIKLKNQTTYLLSGLFFSISLALMSLPYLMAIADCYDFHFVLEPLGYLFLVCLNFLYIFLVSHSEWKKFNLWLVSINFLIVNFCIMALPFKAGGNVFGFALAFLLLPAVFLITISALIHKKFLVTSPGKIIITQNKRDKQKTIELKAVILGMACALVLHLIFSDIPVLKVLTQMGLGLLIIFVSYIIFILPGFIATIVARHSGMLHGGVVGALSFPLIILCQIISGEEISSLSSIYMISYGL
ncbi:MAG TPA: hypothetical protein PK653_06070, partial [Syntrophales bacterium]|nr:hypothetical protein [Syntrophales bacterium]